MELDGHEGTPAKIRTEYNRALDLLHEKIELEGRATELVRWRPRAVDDRSGAPVTHTTLRIWWCAPLRAHTRPRRT